MKATIEIEVPTAYVEARLASIQADMVADHIAGAPEPEFITAEKFFEEIVGMEVESIGAFLGRKETTVKVEIVKVER